MLPKLPYLFRKRFIPPDSNPQILLENFILLGMNQTAVTTSNLHRYHTILPLLVVIGLAGLGLSDIHVTVSQQWHLSNTVPA